MFSLTFKFNGKWGSSASTLLISSYLFRAISCLEYFLNDNISMYSISVEKTWFFLLLATLNNIISWIKSHTCLCLTHTWKYSSLSSVRIVQSERHNSKLLKNKKREREYNSSEFWKGLFNLLYSASNTQFPDLTFSLTAGDDFLVIVFFPLFNYHRIIFVGKDLQNHKVQPFT